MKKWKKEKNTNWMFRSHAIFVAHRLTAEIPLTLVSFIYGGIPKRTRSRGPLQDIYSANFDLVISLCVPVSRIRINYIHENFSYPAYLNDNIDLVARFVENWQYLQWPSCPVYSLNVRFVLSLKCVWLRRIFSNQVSSKIRSGFSHKITTTTTTLGNWIIEKAKESKRENRVRTITGPTKYCAYPARVRSRNYTVSSNTNHSIRIYEGMDTHVTKVLKRRVRNTIISRSKILARSNQT